MTPPTRRVLLTSRTYLRDSAIDNIDILRSSIAHNSRAGISSSLVKAQDRFFQLIEGPPEEVATCIERIAGDRRHFDFEVLLDECDRCPRLIGCPMVFVQDPEAELAGQGVGASCMARRLKRLLHTEKCPAETQDAAPGDRDGDSDPSEG